MKTIIWRHRRENLKKCSLRGLERREELSFYTYPNEPLPSLDGFLLLTIDAPPLTRADSHFGLLLLDGTWRYAERMERQLPPCERRSLPPISQTAYPRRQEECPDPSRGLASVEALYLAYSILGWDVEGLLDHYHWREEFLSLTFSVESPII